MATSVGVSATGNAEIDGLLSGTKWSGALSYSFTDSPSDYAAGYGNNEPNATGFSQISAAMQQAANFGLASVMAFTNLTVTYAGSDGADIRIAQSSAANPTSYAYYPSNSSRGEGGDVWFGTAYNYSGAALGNYFFATAIHELGHALGLKHSQETGGVANVAVPAAHDDLEYSVMSYRSYVGGPLTGYTNESYGFPQSFMANDILALQTMYGTNYNSQSENTVYSWSATTGQEFINGVAQMAPGNGAGGSANRIFMTVWDGNGVDTYDLSSYTTSVTINLNPGASSFTSTAQLAYLGNGHYAQGNIYNAYLYNSDQRSYIDNAVGGSGNDTLVGNAIANTLNGGSGNDTLTGGGGNDTIIGGSGTDVAAYSGNRADYVITYDAGTLTYTVADQRPGTPDGTDTVTGVESFLFANGTFVANALNNHPPVVLASNLSVTRGQTIAASNLFSSTDADGDAPVYYAFIDNTSSATSGHFVSNGVVQAAGQWFLIPAAQLSQVSFVAGASNTTDGLIANVYDGYDWGAGSGAAFDVTVPANRAPVVTASNIVASKAQVISASSVFSTTDADHDAPVYYAFIDNTSDPASGHFVSNGVDEAAGQWFLIPAAQLGQVSFVAGGPGTSDSLVVNAFDGTDWGTGVGASLSVSVPANHAPVIAASDFAATKGQTIAASALFSSTDADHDAPVYYAFIDNTSDPASGHFVSNGIAQAAGQWFLVPGAQLSDVSFVAGSAGSTDNLIGNVFDGTVWGAGIGTSLNVSVAANHAPVVLASDVAATKGQTIAASSLFSTTDADGDAPVYYAFIDNTTNPTSGHFVSNGVTQAAGEWFLIPAAQLPQVSFVAGAAGGTDSLVGNVFDGTSWGAGTGAALNVNVAANHAPVVTAFQISGASGTIAATSLFTTSDADHDAPVYFAFMDNSSNPSSGHFVANGVTEAANQWFLVPAAELSHVSFVTGTSNADSLIVNVFDGMDWGAGIGATAHVNVLASAAGLPDPHIHPNDWVII